MDNGWRGGGTVSDLLRLPSAGMGGQAAMEVSKAIHQPTVTDKLEMQRVHLADALARIDAALEALKANPEIERVMNLVQRASGGY